MSRHAPTQAPSASVCDNLIRAAANSQNRTLSSALEVLALMGPVQDQPAAQGAVGGGRRMVQGLNGEEWGSDVGGWRQARSYSGGLESRLAGDAGGEYADSEGEKLICGE